MASSQTYKCFRCGRGVNFMRLPDVPTAMRLMPLLQCDTCFKKHGSAPWPVHAAHYRAQGWDGVVR